jgi:hypothetical protein
MDKQKTDEVTIAKGFAEGKHVVLRPVLETDLAELAKLMAENPGETLPWTLQRLKKKFEDEKEPGLWSDTNRVFVAVRPQGGVVGYLAERQSKQAGIFWCFTHVADGLDRRDELGRDLVSAYLAYKRKWHNPLRISFEILGCESDKAAWLQTGGFELELTCERMVMHMGRPESICTYAWYSERLEQALASRDQE